MMTLPAEHPQRARCPGRSGFTLIELMVVLAIFGILASIAVPAGMGFMVRARRSERTVTMNALRTSLEFVWQNYNSWTTVSGGASSIVGAPNPPDTPWSSGKKPFNSQVAPWNQLSVIPSGGTFYSYYFSGTSSSPTDSSFVLRSEGDVDFDGVIATHTETWTLQADGTWSSDPASVTDLPVNQN